MDRQAVTVDFCILYSFFRSQLTSYERAIGIGKSRDAAAARKKRKKCKPDDVDEKYHSKKCSRKRCDAQIAKVTSGSSSVCDCDVTVCDLDISRDTRWRRCRGWFASSWPQTSDTSGQCPSSTADQSLLHFTDTSAHRACTKLAELRLECSSAAKWLELKRLRSEDNEALLSSPVGVLWRGSVKPLIQPSQATSVGKTLYYFSAHWYYGSVLQKVISTF